MMSFMRLVEEWNSAGWAEYLLWEVVEGIRERPFVLLDPLTDGQMQMLLRLRDKHRVWVFWDPERSQWMSTTIDTWRDHALTMTSSDAIARFERGRT